MRVVGGGGHNLVLGGVGVKKMRGWLDILQRVRLVGNVG